MDRIDTRPTNLDDAPACLKVPEVAAILGVSRAQAYNLVNSNGFPRLMVGRRFVIPKEALINWIEQNTHTA